VGPVSVGRKRMRLVIIVMMMMMMIVVVVMMMVVTMMMMIVWRSHWTRLHSLLDCKSYPLLEGSTVGHTTHYYFYYYHY